MDRDLEEDLKNDTLIMEKIKDDRYAQNVYAALCNMRWQPAEVWPVLQDDYWSCSWRSAGGVVADLRGVGEDYMDWYCSGIGSGLGNGDPSGIKGYVSEGEVTDEIREDFARLGWHPSPWPKDKD
jgi:hypothetical protein